MSEEKSGGRKIKWRTYASLGISWMFLIMGITGLVLYVVPQGRIAYWVDWRFLGLSKTDWGNIHILASILFIALGGWHLYFNWKAFLGHIRRKLSQGIRVRRELLITSVIAILVTVSAIWHIPPLGYLVDLNEFIKDSWIEEKDDEPPFGHAELLSLKAFARKTNIDLGQAISELKRIGYKGISAERTLEEIAKSNEISPRDIFTSIKQFQRETQPFTVMNLTADEVIERFEGTSLGRKSLLEACEMGGSEIGRCLKRLRVGGIEGDREETLREVASRAGVKPIKVLQTMLVDP